MVRQAFLIIPSKSHEASLPYPGEKMRGPDGRTSCNSVNVLLRKAYMLYWPSARDNHCFPDNVFAVIWLFPTRLPACPPKAPIVGAFGRSLQLWCESHKLFAAVSVCIIRHIDQSIRHLILDSASDCKYRTAGGVPCFVSLIAHECFSSFLFFFCPRTGLHCSQYVTMYNSQCPRLLGVERLHFLTNWTLEPKHVLSRCSTFFLSPLQKHWISTSDAME